MEMFSPTTIPKQFVTCLLDREAILLLHIMASNN